METLTDRQFEVLGLVADGMTNTEIARRLEIEPESVKTHILRTCRKLGARNRANAVHRAHMAGYFRDNGGAADVRA